MHFRDTPVLQRNVRDFEKGKSGGLCAKPVTAAEREVIHERRLKRNVLGTSLKMFVETTVARIYRHSRMIRKKIRRSGSYGTLLEGG